MSREIIKFDRSRVETFQTCPRKRYWQYHYQGLGIERIGLALPLATGTAVHCGIELLIMGSSPDQAVAEALSGYQKEVYDSRVELTEDLDRDLQEQFGLVEGIVRAWGAIRLGYELETYKTLAIEREESARFELGSQTLELMVRPDWLVRRRSDGALFIKNFKTTADADRFWLKQWRYDMQTLSECVAVETRLEQEQRAAWPVHSLEPYCPTEAPPKLSGVIIQGLLKGRRTEYPQGSGKYQHNSPLIRCWHRKGEPPMTEDEFYPLSRYEYSCTEPHKMGNGKQCKGGANHRLSGVYKAEVKDVFPDGIRGWIKWLAENDPQVLHSQIVELDPILRSDYEIARWRAQTLEIEARIARDIKRLEDNPDYAPELLDAWFPMSTQHGNCSSQFGRECTYLDICWGTHAEDPLGTGLYRIRQPNHPTETENENGPSTELGLAQENRTR